MTDQDATVDPSASDDPDEAEESSADIDLEEAPEDVETDEIDLDEIAEDVDERVEEDLIERIEDSSPEDVAREIAALRERTDALESDLEDRDAEIEELESKLKRKQADFQNYKKRMQKRREEEKQRATENLVTRVLDVRDNLERALQQDEDADIRSGVESTLRQLDDVLDAENVEVIDPDAGAEVDPTQHQVLARVESDEEAGTIADVHRPGYEMAEKVLREAQITVSDDE